LGLRSFSLPLKTMAEVSLRQERSPTGFHWLHL
jgi:hypothetical protein